MPFPSLLYSSEARTLTTSKLIGVEAAEMKLLIPPAQFMITWEMKTFDQHIETFGTTDMNTF